MPLNSSHTFRFGWPHALLALFFLGLGVLPAHADEMHCHVSTQHELTPGEKAYLLGNTAQADSLFRDDLKKSPHSLVPVIGLVHSLLREGKVDEADSTLQAELALAPDSVPLIVTLAEIQFRKAKVAEAAATADRAYKANPCNARLYLVRARIFRLNSMYASDRRSINVAHALDPYDSDISHAWIQTLPLKQKIEELKKFMADGKDMDPQERARNERNLAGLQNEASNPGKTCHLVTPQDSTQIPFIPITVNNRRTGAWGLNVFFNNHEAQLELDTGASGLLVSRSIANRAGLRAGTRLEFGGVGNEGPQGGYTSYADSIRIGSLEFHDCLVAVSDSKDVVGIDGLIGANVFSNYLVTIDYPMRRLVLGPLPPLPSGNSTSTSLNTNATDQGPASTPTSNAAPNTATGPQDRYIGPTMNNYTPIYRVGHDLLVPTVLNGKAQKLFLLDTGAFSSSISPQAAKEITKVRGGSPIQIRGINGAVARVSTSDVVIFQFAGIKQQNDDLFSFDTSGISRGNGIEVSGFLGSTILRQLTIHIDYRDGLLKCDFDPNYGNHNF